MRRLALLLLCSCSAEATVEGDDGCLLQAECNLGDWVQDICMGGPECVDAEAIPCSGNPDCGPFGWCDPASAHCAAEGASACVIDGELVNCAMGGQRCCEALDGGHACSPAGSCDGAILEP